MIVGDLVDDGHAEIRTGPFGTQLRASDYVDSGRPVLNVRNVGFGDVRPQKLEHVDESNAQRLSDHILEVGDIVFGRKGAVERHAFIRSDYAGALQGSDCIRLRVVEGAPVRPGFLTFAFRTREHQAWMQRYCSHGATMASLNQDILKQVPLPELSLKRQDAVIDVLQTIDDLIKNNRRRVELLEEMARAIHREWFVHFRFPGHEDATFVGSDLGAIPDGWEVLSLGEVAATERSTVHPKREPDVHFDHYSIPAYDDGQRPSVERGETIRSGKYAVTEPAVMVSKLNPRIPRTWFVVPGSKRAVASTEFVILRPKGQRSLDWIYATVTAPNFEDRMTQLSGGTSGSHQRLRPDEMLAIPVLDPPPDLIARMTGVLQPALAMARSLRLQMERLSSIRDLLLPKLVTGQIDVFELDLYAGGSR